MAGNAQPLDQNTPIVNPSGCPTDFFTRWAQQRQIDISNGITSDQATQLIDDAIAARKIQAGTGITLDPASGSLADDPKISVDLQALLDTISSTRGSILYRGSAAWAALAPGTANYLLQTNGAGADPSWVAAPSGGGGAVVVASGTLATALPAGTYFSVPVPADSGEYRITFEVPAATASIPSVRINPAATTVNLNLYRWGSAGSATNSAYPAAVIFFSTVSTKYRVTYNFKKMHDNGWHVIGQGDTTNIFAFCSAMTVSAPVVMTTLDFSSITGPLPVGTYWIVEKLS